MTRKELAAKLKAHKVKQPFVVIDEAKRADIKVATALAMLEMETEIPQRNIFGCDYGEGRAFCHQNVTKERVAALQRSGLANGVGWTQLTYPPFVVEAQKMGGAHIPRFQMRVGFKVLRQLFDEYDSISLMFEHYNGSGAAAQQYAREAVALRAAWLTVTASA
jgi:hypothetical protein